ncbi:VOC family protein [Amycolatopsis rhabdoformis]|uniref:VOC family protein n=1 Tax=Amycolatopsis rhabdoformis TaxID=1448059 RepID=A0ABZ1I2B0_9PSEU|nr:VOC family protein [Amycolatopsis rhabdoformis]WSE27814.1 VOC family protein [Amycolatopsis rhabdoformis]
MNLDHTVFLATDYDHVWRRYEQLGFTLSPHSRHLAASTSGGEPTLSCTANRCAYFGDSFLEFIGIVDATAGDPWEVLPIVARGDGLHGVSFGVPDTPAAERRLVEAGLSTTGALSLQRDVGTPDGPRTARFRSVHLRRDRTPEGILHTAEHLTPEFVFQPRYLSHPNTATGLDSVQLVVADADLPAYTERYEQILDQTATDNSFQLGIGRLDLVPVTRLDDVLPGEQAPRLPYFAAQTVAVENLATARKLVTEADLPTVDLPRQGFFVPAAHAGGAALGFVER